MLVKAGGRSSLPNETAAEAAFRADVRGWLQAEASQWLVGAPGFVAPGQLDEGELLAAGLSYQRALAAAGLAGLTWPSEVGGRGLTVRHEVIWLQETAGYDLPVYPFLITLGMCAPTLMAHGTAEQRAHLPAMLRGDELWSQLFSEPNAGSDLASLTTRAEPDGDGWRLTGQKVWTTWAHHAAYGLVLARTDRGGSRHRGLTMLVVDFAAPGVSVVPLRQITGEAFFSEVFLEDVPVPAANVVGTVGQGWSVALTTLMNERAAVGSRVRRGNPVGALLRLAHETGRADDPVVRQELTRLACRDAVLTLLGERVISALVNGREPGPEGSLAKLGNARLGLDAAAYAVALRGAGGIAWDPATVGGDSWARQACAAFGPAIGGGTAEIMRNILAERVLGLPKDPVAAINAEPKGAACEPKT